MNQIALCDGHDIDFVTVTGQILMAVHTPVTTGLGPRPGDNKTWESVTTTTAGNRHPKRCPWYRTKATPAPADMHAALRGDLLAARINSISPSQNHPAQITDGTLTSKAEAA